MQGTVDECRSVDMTIFGCMIMGLRYALECTVELRLCPNGPCFKLIGSQEIQLSTTFLYLCYFLPQNPSLSQASW